MRIDGITAIALILILSFAIDRIATGALFLASLTRLWDRWFPDPVLVPEGAERIRAERKQRLLYFLVAATLSIPVLAWVGNVRLLAALGFATHPALDIVVTGLILVGGADRVAHLLDAGSLTESARANRARPIEVTGKLTLDRESEHRVLSGSGE